MGYLVKERMTFYLPKAWASLSNCTATCLVLSPTETSPVDAMSNRQFTSPWQASSAAVLSSLLANCIGSSKNIGTKEAFVNVLVLSPGL